MPSLTELRKLSLKSFSISVIQTRYLQLGKAVWGLSRRHHKMVSTTHYSLALFPNYCFTCSRLKIPGAWGELRIWEGFKKRWFKMDLENKSGIFASPCNKEIVTCKRWGSKSMACLGNAERAMELGVVKLGSEGRARGGNRTGQTVEGPTCSH